MSGDPGDSKAEESDVNLVGFMPFVASDHEALNLPAQRVSNSDVSFLNLNARENLRPPKFQLIIPRAVYLVHVF